MIEFTAREYNHELKRIERELRHLADEIPFAQAYTLTKMAQSGKQAVERRLPRIFNNPTRWTLKSIYMDPATKRSLVSRVGIKAASEKSLAHHIEGGKRPPKRYEQRLRDAGVLRGASQYTVPGAKARLNRHGNLTMASINKIVSAVGGQLDSHANSTKASIGRNKSQADYFVLRRQKGTPPGIYQRKGRGANQRLEPVLIFVKSIHYRRRFPLFEIVSDAAYDSMDGHINKAIDNALKSGR